MRSFWILGYIALMTTVWAQPRRPFDPCDGWTCSRDRAVRMRIERPTAFLGGLAYHEAMAALLSPAGLRRIGTRNHSPGAQHFYEMPFRVEGKVPVLVAEAIRPAGAGHMWQCAIHIRARERIIEPEHRWRSYDRYPAQWVNGWAPWERRDFHRTHPSEVLPEVAWPRTTELYYQIGSDSMLSNAGTGGFGNMEPASTLSTWEIYPPAFELGVSDRAFFGMNGIYDPAPGTIGIIRPGTPPPANEGINAERALADYNLRVAADRATREEHPQAPCVRSTNRSYASFPWSGVEVCPSWEPGPIRFQLRATGPRGRLVGPLLNQGEALGYARTRFVEQTRAIQSSHRRPSDARWWTQRFRAFRILGHVEHPYDDRISSEHAPAGEVLPVPVCESVDIPNRTQARAGGYPMTVFPRYHEPYFRFPPRITWRLPTQPGAPISDRELESD